MKNLIAIQLDSSIWGDYSRKLLEEDQFFPPKRGKHDDKAHPPIHPVKHLVQGPDVTNDEWRIYELVTRYFLGCCSKDAKGDETNVEIQIRNEFFHTTGLIVREYNYLEVYTYDKWNDNNIPAF